ncbi:MAG: glycosyltransferase family 2 protein [Gammaproteobacteria bacterium]|nr:glycosyltransferase family 2 protein [Gammaproteobacteria bacterium]
MKKVSIILPCYNEEDNIPLLYEKLNEAIANLTQYQFDYIFIDNASQDQTVPLLKELAARDPRVKIIVNARNFGQVRSPYYGITQADGDAVILMASDLQDPPSLIPEFIKKWEEGYKVVAGTKPASQESKLMFLIRRTYYKMIARFAEVNLIQNFTGFGLYDRKVVEILRTIEDPNPYLRGLISEIGFKVAEVPFNQPRRMRGITKNNFYSLYDIAMLGITSHSKVPIRIATISGFILSGISMLIAVIYLTLKIIFWNQFSLGMAPVLIGLFFFSSVQLFFIGLLGEYLTSVHTHVMKRPRVIEEERINF